MQAIETYYNGYKFRSRLEARWAVFFDALGVEYEYEPEGFTLNSGRKYLPDFRVKCWGTRGEIWDKPFDLYVEVKGEMTQEDADKIHEFSRVKAITEDGMHYWSIQNPILIIGNIPNPDLYRACSDDLKCYDQMNGINIYQWNYETIDGDYFAAYPAVENGCFYLDGDDSNYQTMDTDIICEAFRKARQARFEHGESPSEHINNFFAITDCEDNNIIIRPHENGFTISHPQFKNNSEIFTYFQIASVFVLSIGGKEKLKEFVKWTKSRKR